MISDIISSLEVTKFTNKHLLVKQNVAPGVTEVLPGQAWVVPNMLSAEECADWVRRGEAAGLARPKDARNR